jgi:hypothetical protein
MEQQNKRGLGPKNISNVSCLSVRIENSKPSLEAEDGATGSPIIKESKALILRWVAQKYPHVRAQPEEATQNRERRADVMLTWPNGQQLAIEVQYALETPAKWSERHNSYLEQGIGCLWVFGHQPPHLKTSKYDQDRVALSDLHRQILSEQVPVHWINPIREEVGVAVNKHRIHACANPNCYDGVHDREYWAAAESHESAAYLAIDPLFSCTLTPEGILLPSLEQSRSQRLAFNAARAVAGEGLVAQNAIEIERLAARNAARTIAATHFADQCQRRSNIDPLSSGKF